jgi:hypothetical protein
LGSDLQGHGFRADFADLTRKAKEAQATLKDLQRVSDEESKAEARGATEAAAAHEADARAIDSQRSAMERALAVAKLYNQQVNQGGRTTADQHLADLTKETQQQRLLNYQRQRGFTTPQADYAFRQQEINQRRLANVADWGGYQSKDQYLNSQQREVAGWKALNDVMARRAQLVRDITQAQTQRTNVETGGGIRSAGQIASAGSTSLDTAVKDAQAQLKNTLADISKARVSGSTADSGAVRGELTAVAAAIKDIQNRAKGLDVQPTGLNKLVQGFKDAQAEAARTFDDIEAKGKKSSDGVAASWQKTRGAFHDVFSDLRTAADAAAEGVEGRFASAGARIKAVFSGFGGGAGGGGIAAAFGDLGQTVGGLASAIPGAVGAITAAILALIQLLPPLAAGIGAVAASAAALPALLFAAGGAFVTFQSAIMPVISALQAYSQLLNAQQAIQAGNLNTIMQQQAAYHSLADAQFALSQAVINSSNQQVTAAHAVADAQYNLKQAYFQAGIQQLQTIMSLQSAQHSLQDANFSVTQSQYALTMAWQQARFQLQQLQLTVSGASLNLRGAQLQLEEAQQNYAQVMAQSTSTALERAQAAYQIQVAEQALKQTTLTNKENETQLQNVRKYGMQQVFGVTQAEHALADAQFSQLQAQKQLIITQKEAANAQIQSAHAIEDAIFGVQQAYFQQQQGAVQGAHSISDAAFSVQQAQEQMKLDAQAGGAAAVSAYEQLQTALSQLSPAAAKAVKTLEPIFMWWNNNTKAQQAFFGVLNKNLAALGPGAIRLIHPLNEMLDAIAKALGGVAGKFLDWFTKFANSKLWTVLTGDSVTIITRLGDGFLYLAKGMALLAGLGGPLAKIFSKQFLDWAREFRNWVVQEMKPGSLLHVLIKEAPSALQALYSVLKSLVDVILILAGGTPQYNQQGVLQGVIPSGTQLGFFKTFLYLAASLANQILPTLALVLNKLASPQMANAVINLLTALSNLLLQVVTSPGFTAAFIAFTDAFAGLVTALGAITTPMGSLLGIIAGAFVAMSVLKFTGILALASHIKQIAGYVKGIKDAEGFFGKLGSIFGGGKGPGGPSGGITEAGATAGTTIAEKMVTAGEEVATTISDAMVSGGTTAGAEIETAETAGGAASGAEQGAGAATGGLAAGGLGALVGRAGLAALALGVGDIVLHGLTSLMPKQSAAAERAATAGQPGFLVGLDKKIYGPKIVDFVAWWDAKVKNPVDNWITHTLPNALTDKSFEHYWNNAYNWFIQYVQNPVNNFFSNLIPDWLGAAGKGWSGLVQDMENFWTNDIWHPVYNFFSRDIPGWLDDIGRFWKDTWDTAWGDFNSLILHPLENFFSRTVPNAIEGAIGGALKWVVGKLNTVLGWINDATKLVGIPAIKPIPTTGLAGGGLMPMRGGGPRQDNRLIRASDGEFMVNAASTRKHRGLIEAINADTAGYAGGGGIGGFFSGLWNSVSSGAGDIWGSISGAFNGALGKIGSLLAREGAEPVVNAIFGHLVNPLLSAAGVNAQTEDQLVPHIIAYLAGDLHKQLDNILSNAGSPAGNAIHVVGGVSGNVASWSPEVRSVLAQTGEPAGDLAAVLHRIAQESGGVPTIVNKWDSNWLAGHPSVGLMQVIQGTFDTYAGPYRNVGPFEYGVSVDPIANIYAGINYAKHAYNEPLIDVMLQPGGYAAGGPLGLGFGAVPAMSYGNVRLPGVAGSASGAARQMSPAAMAARSGQPMIGNMTINNPLPERAGDSITRSVMKAGFLAGRGIA